MSKNTEPEHMKITAKKLRQSGACEDLIHIFEKHFPRGGKPTVKNMMLAESIGLDTLWLTELLPETGPGSRQAFSLWCVEQIKPEKKRKLFHRYRKHLRKLVADPTYKIDEALPRYHVLQPLTDISDAHLALKSAFYTYAYTTAQYARRNHVHKDVIHQAQIACLSQLLLEA